MCFFVPGVSGLVVGLLNVNLAVAVFNIVVGLVSIAIALSSRSERVAMA